jgi:hypothetical protein
MSSLRIGCLQPTTSLLRWHVHAISVTRADQHDTQNKLRPLKPFVHILQFCFRTVRRQELSSHGSEHVKLPWHTDICCVQNPPCPVRPTPRCPLTVSHISITASCTPSPWFTARPSCRKPRQNHVYSFGIRYKYSSCTTDFNTDWILWNITSKQQKCLQFCLHFVYTVIRTVMTRP